jgi:hypothetical protein
MIGINVKIWSHNTQSPSGKEYNRDIRLSAPKIVNTYSSLIEEISNISYYNSRFFIFYRGQSKEYYTSGKKKRNTSIFSSIYRDFGTGVSSNKIENRFKNLDHATNQLLKIFSGMTFLHVDKLKKYPELAWSILQHYQICPTPLLDITHSLLVAASFALNKSDNGLLYVFGLPIITNGISFSIEDELLNVKLLSCCPPYAKRPYYQEGYLFSTFPARIEKRHLQLDCAKRLLAKFQLVNQGQFWTAGFSELRQESLYPTNDDLMFLLQEQIRDYPYPDEFEN